MKFFENPKNSMWICRILPFACIAIFVFLLLVLKKGENEPVILPLMLIDYAIYGSFILFYLPALLFEGKYRVILTRFKGFLGTAPWWYWLFAAATIGLGPLFWYWQKIDSVLKEMVRTHENKSNR